MERVEIKKSCDNCEIPYITDRCNRNKACSKWKPDYQTLESELQQYKRALRSMANEAENEISCPPEESRACCQWQGDREACIDCIVNYYITKAKGGQ